MNERPRQDIYAIFTSGTPGLANVRISGYTVRRRLRESGARARRPVVGQILKQHQRLSRARARQC